MRSVHIFPAYNCFQEPKFNTSNANIQKNKRGLLLAQLREDIKKGSAKIEQGFWVRVPLPDVHLNHSLGPFSQGDITESKSCIKETIPKNRNGITDVESSVEENNTEIIRAVNHNITEAEHSSGENDNLETVSVNVRNTEEIDSANENDVPAIDTFTKNGSTVIAPRKNDYMVIKHKGTSTETIPNFSADELYDL